MGGWHISPHAQRTVRKFPIVKDSFQRWALKKLLQTKYEVGKNKEKNDN